MSKNKETWNTRENAEAYDIYASNFPMYKDTSKDLVAIADIKYGSIVIDLAAGTGVTTQAIIDMAGEGVRIIAVDQAEEMLKKIEEKFPRRNIQLVISEAENLDKVVNELVDVVICNSAFWQMRQRETFMPVANLLKQNGIFVFNLPDSAIYNKEDLIQWGREAGLVLIKQLTKTYNKTAEEMIAFNEIPVMKRNFKTEDEKNKFILKLKEESTGIPIQRQWAYFVFKKI